MNCLHKLHSPKYFNARASFQSRSSRVGIPKVPLTRTTCNAAVSEVLTRERVQSSIQINEATVVDGFYTIQGRLIVSAPASRVYNILTDYENGSQIFSSIKDCEVASTAQGKELLQTLLWKFFAFSGTFQTRMIVYEDPSNSSLVFKAALDSEFMKDFQGRWIVRQADNDCCVVEHTLSVGLSIPMPGPVAQYTKAIFVRQVKTVLEELDTEITRLY